MEAWEIVVDCKDVEGFEYRVEAFEVVCSPWPIFALQKCLWIGEEDALENEELSVFCMLGYEWVVLEIEGKRWMCKIVAQKNAEKKNNKVLSVCSI